jgi:hypothetical protein
MRDECGRGRERGQGKGTYVVKHLVDCVEAREEAGFLGPGHFVGDAGHAVFGADDAVVCGVEAELDGLWWC